MRHLGVNSQITKSLPKDKIFTDKQSDKNFERPAYKNLLAILQKLSIVVKIEKEFNHQRQAEGIAAAKARGVKFGRKPIEQPKNFSEVCANWQQGKISARKAAKILGVSHNTFLKWV